VNGWIGRALHNASRHFGLQCNVGAHNGLYLGKNKEHSVQAIANDDVLCPLSQSHCDLLLCSSGLGFSISLERLLRFGWNLVLDTHKQRKHRTTYKI
jgi:hypothetical protein